MIDLSPSLSFCRSRLMPGVLLLIAFCCAVWAQSEAGQIAGKITDQSGAAIPGAAVTVKSADTGIVRDATTDSGGFYLVSGLQPGLYDVQVQSTGFAPRTQRVRVSVGAARRVETQLSVNPVTENQEVVEGSGGVEINTASQQLSDPISGRQIRELPTITRDPYDLVTLSGNVTQTTNPNGIGGQRDIAYSISGPRVGSTSHCHSYSGRGGRAVWSLAPCLRQAGFSSDASTKRGQMQQGSFSAVC
ncbi:MAG: carboxypeptidase-like regulatory domain-containing protein [Blastocatellia bacterium]